MDQFSVFILPLGPKCMIYITNGVGIFLVMKILGVFDQKMKKIGNFFMKKSTLLTYFWYFFKIIWKVDGSMIKLMKFLKK